MRSEERVAPIVGSHLSDDQLMETYVLAGDNRHLAICRPCKTRFDDLVRALEQVREDATREADQIFTNERLHDQHDRIMRRLERHGHSAEVVRFPTRSSAPPDARRVIGPARRWVAGAAAAGLAAGLVLGFSMDRPDRIAGTTPSVAPGVTAATWRAAVARDDQFLTEIDDALMGSRATELRAIDAMTTPVEIREASYPR
jgi:hypothetical protein